MGLGRPADPEHIGDTFLWMKRSEKGPNTFSQTIKDLEPGRLYSMKMFTCDYQDLVNPQARKRWKRRTKFIGTRDARRSRGRHEAVVHRNVCLEPRAAKSRSGSPITGRSSGPKATTATADRLRLAERQDPGEHLPARNRRSTSWKSSRITSDG